MSKADAALIVSRAFSVYFICWAIFDMTYIPARLYAMHHYANGVNHFLYVLESISLAQFLIRPAVLFIAAGIFYTCGPKLQAFFLNSESEVKGST